MQVARDGGDVRSAFRHETQLSAKDMATIPSGIPDPETILIERESQEDVDDDATASVIPPKLHAVLTEFLPIQEAMLLEAYFLQEQTQRVIAQGLRRPKQSIQYRIRRALERARWALQLETWNRTPTEIAVDLGAIMGAAEVDFVVVLWENGWNQSHTAEWFGTRQSAIRVRVLKLHTLLVEHTGNAQVAPYARDLSRVIQARAWCMGSGQTQGKRAITFPVMRRLAR